MLLRRMPWSRACLRSIHRHGWIRPMANGRMLSWLPFGRGMMTATAKVAKATVITVTGVGGVCFLGDHYYLRNLFDDDRAEFCRANTKWGGDLAELEKRWQDVKDSLISLDYLDLDREQFFAGLLEAGIVIVNREGNTAININLNIDNYFKFYRLPIGRQVRALYDNEAVGNYCTCLCQAHNSGQKEIVAERLNDKLLPLLERQPWLWYTAAPILFEELPQDSLEFKKAWQRYVDYVGCIKEDLFSNHLLKLSRIMLDDKQSDDDFFRARKAFAKKNFESCLLDQHTGLKLFFVLGGSWVRVVRPNLSYWAFRSALLLHFSDMLLAIKDSCPDSRTRVYKAALSAGFDSLFHTICVVVGRGDHEVLERLLDCFGGKALTGTMENGYTPFHLAVMRGKERSVVLLQSRQPKSEPHVKLGAAYEECMRAKSPIVRFQAFSQPIRRSGSGIGAKHSFAVVTTCDGDCYVIEKYDEEALAEEDQFKNGVFVSDIRAFTGHGEHWDRYFNLEINPDHDLKVSDVRRAMVETGPYSLDRANCQHAVEAAQKHIQKRIDASQQQLAPKPNQKEIDLLQTINAWFGSSCCNDGSKKAVIGISFVAMCSDAIRSSYRTLTGQFEQLWAARLWVTNCVEQMSSLWRCRFADSDEFTWCCSGWTRLTTYPEFGLLGCRLPFLDVFGLYWLKYDVFGSICWEAAI